MMLLDVFEMSLIHRHKYCSQTQQQLNDVAVVRRRALIDLIDKVSIRGADDIASSDLCEHRSITHDRRRISPPAIESAITCCLLASGSCSSIQNIYVINMDHHFCLQRVGVRSDC